MSAGYPRLATPADLPRLISNSGVHHEWPPPGTTVQRLGFPEPWEIVWGTPSDGAPSDWWVTDLGTVTGLSSSLAEQLLIRLGGLFTGPVAVFAGVASQWPVIYQPNGDQLMRYLKVTHRGTLGALEQFQWQFCLGLPGADPDLSEAQALTLAEELQGLWATAHAFGGVTSLAAKTGNDVTYTEVGVVQEFITSATSSDGSGGNLEQSFTTQWAPHPVGARPVGTGGQSLPYEVACCVTLQSDKRGPSGRGRFYLPPFAANQMNNGGVWFDATRASAGNAIGKYFDDIRAAHTYEPVVVSKRRLVLNTVQQALVGIVPDSQRRRRKNQTEARFAYWTAT